MWFNFSFLMWLRSSFDNYFGSFQCFFRPLLDLTRDFVFLIVFLCMCVCVRKSWIAVFRVRYGYCVESNEYKRKIETIPQGDSQYGHGRSQAHCVARSRTGAGCSLDKRGGISKSLASSPLDTMPCCSFAWSAPPFSRALSSML